MNTKTTQEVNPPSADAVSAMEWNVQYITKNILKIDWSNTPSRIRSGRNICILLSGLFFGMFMGYHSDLSHDFKTIGRDSAPSIVLAENIRFLLASANTNALLAASEKTNNEARSADIKNARKLLDEARERVVDASSNITFGDEERKPLTKLINAIGAYDQALGNAIAHDYNNNDMFVADDILQNKALPAASELDQANFNHLANAYESHKKNTYISAIPALGLAAALFCFLLWTQIDIFRQTNRVLNKGYLVASVTCVLFFLVSSFYTLSAESALKIAKKDAFESVHALWLTKSVAYQAKGERVAMTLTEKKSASYLMHERKWEALSRKIVDTKSNNWRETMTLNKGRGVYMEDAFANITFEGEREGLKAAVKGWVDFLDSENNLQKEEKGFENFSKGIDLTLNINQKVFDQEVDIAMSRLSMLPWMAVVMLLACIGGCYFGSKERLDEYRF